MNPYTPPEHKPDSETVRQGDMEFIQTTRSSRWITIAGYSSVIFGVGLVASLLAYSFIPNARLDMPSPNTTGVRADMAIGARQSHE